MTRLPNVVVVLADDMGYGDVGFLNRDSRIATPNMDRIATEGMVCTDAHSSSAVCTPSRYSLLTGRYCWRSNLPYGVLGGYEPPLIERGRLTLAGMLKQHGYATAAVGKWHLGLEFSAREGEDIAFDAPLPWPSPDREFEAKIDFDAPLGGGPLDLGFDYFFGTAGCPTCQPPYSWIFGDRFTEPPDVYEEKFPYTGRPGMKSASWDHRDADPTIAAKAVEWISSVPADQPFFLYVGLDSPHEPCADEVNPPAAVGKSDAGPRGDLVWLVDQIVGQIDAALDRRGFIDDTILIVTSDNGALPGDRVLDDDGVEVYRRYNHDSSGPWRGHKAHIWEGGHRVPLILRWPGRIPSGDSTDALTCLGDLFASIAGLIGASLPDDAAEDSFDLSEVILGRSDSGVRDTLISHSQKGVFSVRAGSWKAIFGTKGSGGWPPPSGGSPEDGAPGQLYDLAMDPSETNDLWDRHPEKVRELRAILDAAVRGDRTAPFRSVPDRGS